METFGRLLGRLRPYRPVFFASLAAATVASVFDGFTLVLLMPFLRLLFEGDGGLGLSTILALMLGAMVGKNLAHYAAVTLGASVQERVVRDLRVDTFRALQTQGLAFFQRSRVGDLVTRLVADTEQVRTAVSLALASTVRNGVLVLVYLVILLALSWRLALVTLLLAPALALVLRPLWNRVRARAQVQVAARGALGAHAAEVVGGARVIKAQTAEAAEAARFEMMAGGAADAAVRYQRVAALASPLGEVLGTLLLMALLVLGLVWPIRPEVFLTFLAVVMRLLPPVKQIAQFPAQVGDALAAARRVFALLDRTPEDVDAPGAVPFPGLRTAIRFEDVHVAYPDGTEALRGVTLEVRKGEIVAVTGPSGVGKSTLVNLLPRLVEPTRGRVLLDGVPVSAYTRASLRRAVGYVGQETIVFHDTVRANIALGTPEAGDADIERAARQAHAHAFIRGLPDGYDTVLEERGTRLSGGERQRIALARVLLRDPEILILDEATSALDPESEQVVQDALAQAFAGRTVLVIAHRETTLALARRRLTVDRGRVVCTPI